MCILLIINLVLNLLAWRLLLLINMSVNLHYPISPYFLNQALSILLKIILTYLRLLWVSVLLQRGIIKLYKRVTMLGTKLPRYIFVFKVLFVDWSNRSMSLSQHWENFRFINRVVNIIIYYRFLRLIIINIFFFL